MSDAATMMVMIITAVAKIADTPVSAFDRQRLKYS
jgi:hypothetical protein